MVKENCRTLRSQGGGLREVSAIRGGRVMSKDQIGDGVSKEGSSPKDGSILIPVIL